MRADWIAEREARGDKVFTQMHYARQGTITQEMAFAAAREGLEAEFVRSEVNSAALSSLSPQLFLLGFECSGLTLLSLPAFFFRYSSNVQKAKACSCFAVRWARLRFHMLWIISQRFCSPGNKGGSDLNLDCHPRSAASSNSNAHCLNLCNATKCQMAHTVQHYKPTAT